MLSLNEGWMGAGELLSNKTQLLPFNALRAGAVRWGTGLQADYFDYTTSQFVTPAVVELVVQARGAGSCKAAFSQLCDASCVCEAKPASRISAAPKNAFSIDSFQSNIAYQLQAWGGRGHNRTSWLPNVYIPPNADWSLAPQIKAFMDSGVMDPLYMETGGNELFFDIYSGLIRNASAYAAMIDPSLKAVREAYPKVKQGVIVGSTAELFLRVPSPNERLQTWDAIVASEAASRGWITSGLVQAWVAHCYDMGPEYLSVNSSDPAIWREYLATSPDVMISNAASTLRTGGPGVPSELWITEWSTKHYATPPASPAPSADPLTTWWTGVRDSWLRGLFVASFVISGFREMDVVKRSHYAPTIELVRNEFPGIVATVSESESNFTAAGQAYVALSALASTYNGTVLVLDGGSSVNDECMSIASVGGTAPRPRLTGVQFGEPTAAAVILNRGALPLATSTPVLGACNNPNVTVTTAPAGTAVDEPLPFMPAEGVPAIPMQGPGSVVSLPVTVSASLIEFTIPPFSMVVMLCGD
jgi:hypothetical protein